MRRLPPVWAADSRLHWVNRGSNSQPTSGQQQPYTKFLFSANGAVSQRERKFDNGTTQVLDFFWDGQDRLRTVKQGGADFFTAEYNGDGLRVKKSDTRAGALTPHVFSWSPFGVLHDSHQDTTYTPGWSQRANSVDGFFHADWLGSTRYLSDGGGNNFPSGLRFDAYGNRSATAGADHPTDMLFAGQWGYQTEYQTGSEPGLGLQYLEQRYYDPVIGRFLSPDPIGFLGV